MNAARRLLDTPPLVVVAFYAVVLVLMRLLEPAGPQFLRNAISALFMCSFWTFAVVWAFALYSVAHPAIRMGRGIVGKAVFGATFISFVISIALQSLHGTLIVDGDPVSFVFQFAPVLLATVSIGFAVSALNTFEGGNGWSFTEPGFNTIVAILFLPIGIWFLRGRIQKLLFRTG